MYLNICQTSIDIILKEITLMSNTGTCSVECTAERTIGLKSLSRSEKTWMEQLFRCRLVCGCLCNLSCSLGTNTQLALTR